MLRFFCALFGIDYQVCRSCQMLEEQLRLVNKERAQLLETILSMTKPEVVQAQPIIVEPLVNKAIPWNKRKAILEEESRAEAAILKKIGDEEKKLGIKSAS